MREILTALADMFPDTIMIRRVTTDGWGAETPGAVTSYKAQVSGKVQQVRNPEGKTVRSSVMAIVVGTGFKPSDIVTLPSRFSPNQPPIIAIDAATDENGAHHETIYF